MSLQDTVEQQVGKIILDIIAIVAPDADLSDVNPNVGLRDQLDMDSMDFLDIVMELRKRYKVEVPKEEYPEDHPYPSRLVLGTVDNRPLHVVAADNTVASETIIITVYEPDPRQWEAGFRQRKLP